MSEQTPGSTEMELVHTVSAAILAGAVVGGAVKVAAFSAQTVQIVAFVAAMIGGASVLIWNRIGASED